MRQLTSFFNHAFTCFVVLTFFILTTSCEKSVFETEQTAAGDILRTIPIHDYSKDEIVQILSSLQVPDSFDVSFSVRAIAIIYQTTDAYGNHIQASGALLIPQDTGSLPVLSLQHGTETKRDRVASVNPTNSVEGVTGLLTASLGYITCIPDYPGFGISLEVHPYMHAGSLANSVIDFLTAAKSYCINNNITLNNQLFLTGYSEGGYSTLAVQKEIEEKYSQQFNITAVAPMAGPYDLKGTSDFLFQQLEYKYPAYIAYLFYAYDTLYQWKRLDEIFQTPYSEKIPALFDGSKTFAEINNQLPTSFHSLLKQNFIENYINGNETALSAALAENSLLNWTPSAPIHFFHGDADDVAPYQNVISAIESFKANGATNIKLTTIPGGTHESSGLPSVFGAVSWFESLRNHSPK